MKIAVMGAGGVGAYFGGLLARKGHEVSLIARGEHLKALQEQGLTVKSVHGDFHLPLKAVGDPKEIGPVDLVLFTVKAYDTEKSAEQLLPILKEDTVVLNLQNGIGNEEILAKIIGQDKVLGGLTYIETTIERPGVISQKSVKRDIIFGEMNGEMTDRAKKLQQILQEAEIPTILSDNIQKEMWKKFMFISSFSAITTITESAAGEILSCEKTDRLFRKLLEEVYHVAKGNQIELTEKDVEAAYQIAKNMGPTTKSSMLRDFEKKKQIEVDTLSGAVVKYGKKVNVPTPYHEMVDGVLTLKASKF
ncbi:ketopantoate reductase family protein [Tepidibacillus sp. LV47]|uniref:ketopantoate reductase family protein n=1 Tax=Tepidibacillus sp. LV47 TaxID=3398228 RepID=UPI003AAF6ADC